MSVPSCELKLRTRAAANAGLIAALTWPNAAGNQIFQWFDRQLAQGDLGSRADGRAAVTVTRVSSLPRINNQSGTTSLSQPRLQVNCYAYSAEQARQVAAAVTAFMSSMTLCSASAPSQNPSFLLNERAGMVYELEPPAYVQTQDWRVFNREDIS